MENETKYITSDLYLTAYLKVKGYKYIVNKIKSKSNFIFDETDELLVEVNQYLSEVGYCEPLSYANAIKNIKNFLYNKK